MNMNPTKTKSLAGPLILITIGTMFLIQNLSHINVFKVFWRYWPVLLIAIGISKLLEYFRGSNVTSR
jgi:cell wall-active antibiotic response 4TMS protein YvqF